MKNQNEEIKAFIEPVLTEIGIDLIEVQVHGRANRTIVRIFVDEIGGISIDRCTQASRAISDFFDQKDLIPNRYILEVSSPGTDRPLYTSKDFLRHVGKKVLVRYQIDQNNLEAVGTIQAIENNWLVLSNARDTVSIEIEKILTGTLIVEFTDHSSGKNYEE